MDTASKNILGMNIHLKLLFFLLMGFVPLRILRIFKSINPFL